MTNEAITFKNVSKKFRLGQKLLLKEALVELVKPNSIEYFWALRDVTFSVQKGETLGILGKNGSGKSTLLKLIAGIMVPTLGQVQVHGRVAPLIELGAGFHPELTGRENIYINGTILGLTREEIDEKFQKIVDFSELENFIDTPIKHYSSGMYVRLGFSIAVNVNPEILLVDELLTVGDENFREKCMAKMREFVKNKVTIVFVSHDLEVMKHFCTRIIELDGQILNDGSPEKVTNAYKRRH